MEGSVNERSLRADGDGIGYNGAGSATGVGGHDISIIQTRQCTDLWIPAFAGMTDDERVFDLQPSKGLGSRLARGYCWERFRIMLRLVEV